MAQWKSNRLPGERYKTSQEKKESGSLLCEMNKHIHKRIYIITTPNVTT